MFFSSSSACLEKKRNPASVLSSPFLTASFLRHTPLSLLSCFQMQFMLLFSRQGKLRLQKWYVPLSDKEKKKITRELVQTVLARKPKMCSFLEWRDLKIVYKRWVGGGWRVMVEGSESTLWWTLTEWSYFTPAWAIHRPVIHQHKAQLEKVWSQRDNGRRGDHFCLITTSLLCQRGRKLADCWWTHVTQQRLCPLIAQ